jgi:hypothetical protein
MPHISIAIALSRIAAVDETTSSKLLTCEIRNRVCPPPVGKISSRELPATFQTPFFLMCDVRVNATTNLGKTARLLTTNAYSAHHIAYLMAVSS